MIESDCYGGNMSFKHGDIATYIGSAVNDKDTVIEEPVVIDEALDDDNYAVRYLDDDEIFTVHISELT